MIVDTEMGHMRGHPVHGILTPASRKALASRVELQNRGAILKTLGPLRPAPRRVPAVHRKYRRTDCRVIGLIQVGNLVRGNDPKPLQCGQKISRGQLLLNMQCASPEEKFGYSRLKHHLPPTLRS